MILPPLGVNCGVNGEEAHALLLAKPAVVARVGPVARAARLPQVEGVVEAAQVARVAPQPLLPVPVLFLRPSVLLSLRCAGAPVRYARAGQAPAEKFPQEPAPRLSRPRRLPPRPARTFPPRPEHRRPVPCAACRPGDPRLYWSATLPARPCAAVRE